MLTTSPKSSYHCVRGLLDDKKCLKYKKYVIFITGFHCTYRFWVTKVKYETIYITFIVIECKDIEVQKWYI